MAAKQKWTRGRLGWIFGSVLIFVVGGIIGHLLGSIWLGLFIALIVSLGWLIAYESWRGRNIGVDDPSHGVEL